MKKLLLFLGAAAIIGTASAFTANMMVPPSTGTYLLVDGVWVPESMYPETNCVTSGNTCTYNKIDDEPGENGEFQNPANFEEAQEGTAILNP